MGRVWLLKFHNENALDLWSGRYFKAFRNGLELSKFHFFCGFCGHLSKLKRHYENHVNISKKKIEFELKVELEAIRWRPRLKLEVEVELELEV